MGNYIAVDGSNLAVDERRNHSLDRLMSAVKALRDQCSPAKVVIQTFVDATLRFQLMAPEKKQLNELIQRGDIIQAPAGGPADPFILEAVQRNQGIVVSNDLFRDHIQSFPWLASSGAGRCVAAMYEPSTKTWVFRERNTHSSPRTLSQLLSINRSGEPVDIKPELVFGRSDKYRSSIGSDKPAALVFMLDQSGSMHEGWTTGGSKHFEVARMVNTTIEELIRRCWKNGTVRDRFHVAVFGYGGTGVGSLLPGTTTKDPFLPISKIWPLGKAESSTEDGMVIERLRWFEAVADGGTPMCEAYRVVKDALTPWVKNHRDSFPPIVINITDGEANDGNPIESASELTALETNDGNALLFVAHISKLRESQVRYPIRLPEGLDDAARSMFSCSSRVPDSMIDLSKSLFDVPIEVGARGFLLNADADEVLRLLIMGSTVTTKA